LDANPASDAKPNPALRDPRITRDVLHDMRMPPYMRDSDATPLSLTRRQYQFLMKVLKRLESPGASDLVPVTAVAGKTAAAPRLMTRVREHVQQVVERRSLGVAEGAGKETKPAKRVGTSPKSGVKSRKKK
jgi:hypothetical protein